jgi:zinc protease
VVLVDKDITQANIILGNLGIARSNPDFYALQVMNYILGGGGFASRLLDNIRVNRGLAYSVSSQFNPGLEPGPFAVTLETKNASAKEAVEQVLSEIKRIREQPVSDSELNDAKSFLIGSFPRKMDALAKRAWLMGYAEFYGLGLDYPWRYPELIRNLTAGEIQKAAWKYLHPDKFLLVVVGKKSEIPPLFGAAAPSGEEEKKDVQKKTNN